MREFTLYRCDYCGNKKNTYYPHKVIISNADDLAAVAAYDHVAAQYRSNHRSIKDFIQSDCMMLDLDNTHSEDPAEWKTPEHVAAAFQGVEFYAVESRNHMRVKAGKAARPKHHYYFPINEVQDAAEYEYLKDWIISAFPFFDTGAKDSARMFYGVENPRVYPFGGGTGAD